MSNLNKHIKFQVFDPTTQSGFNVSFGQLKEFILSEDEDLELKVEELEKPEKEIPAVVADVEPEDEPDPILDPPEEEEKEEIEEPIEELVEDPGIDLVEDPVEEPVDGLEDKEGEGDD